MFKVYSTCVWSTFEIVSHRQPKLKSKSPPTKTSLPHFASSLCVLGLMQNDVGKTAADTTQVKWHAPFFNNGFLFFFFFFEVKGAVLMLKWTKEVEEHEADSTQFTFWGIHPTKHRSALSKQGYAQEFTR